MKLLPEHCKVSIAIGVTDMRKSINGLCRLAAENFAYDLFAESLFVFSNRRRDIIKILFRDRNGFRLWYKRLEKDRFCRPESEEEMIHIDSSQLSRLLAGLDINKAHSQRFHRRI